MERRSPYKGRRVKGERYDRSLGLKHHKMEEGKILNVFNDEYLIYIIL